MFRESLFLGFQVCSEKTKKFDNFFWIGCQSCRSHKHTGFCILASAESSASLCIIMVAYVGLDSGRFMEELSKGSIFFSFFKGNITSDWTSFKLRTLKTSGQPSVTMFSLVLCLHWHFCEKCSVSALEASQSLMAKDTADFQGWSCCLPDPDPEQNPLFT